MPGLLQFQSQDRLKDFALLPRLHIEIPNKTALPVIAGVHLFAPGDAVALWCQCAHEQN
jgi:hypothetical protein